MRMLTSNQVSSEELVKIDQEKIWHPFTSLQSAPPIHISHGKGAYLYTHSGEKIIDAVSSWWVNIHGHANPRIAEALTKQANEIAHVIFAGFTHTPAIELIYRLLPLLPGHQKRAFFSDNGSTSVEVALKMALQYWSNTAKNKDHQRKKIIAMDGAYHGDTFGAMSVGARNLFSEPFNDHMFEVSFIPFPDETHFEEVLRQFQQLVAQNDVAAFIFEPLIQGTAGMRTYRAAHLDLLIETAHQASVICIADEVMTGFGRTGSLFACDQLEHAPDIFCLSKGLTGGNMALGLTTANAKIVAAFNSPDALKTLYHGHSYTGNPLACAVALESLKITLEEECIDNRARIEQKHSTFLNHIQLHSKIKDIRLQGTILAMELDTGEASTYFNSIREKIYPYFISKGILLRPLGNVIYILPPYVIKDQDLDDIYQAIEDFLNHEI